MLDHSALPCIGHFGLYFDFAIEAGMDGEVAEVNLRDSHQGHIAEDAARCPVVVVVEVAAREHGDDTHRKLLLCGLLVQIGRDVEERRVVARSPGTRLPAIDPKVVAIEHAVEAKHDTLTFPSIGNMEGCSVIAGQRISVMVSGFAKTICFPTSRYVNLAPRFIQCRYGKIIRDTFDHLDVPNSIQTLLHLRVCHWQNALEGIFHLGSSRGKEECKEGEEREE